MTIKAWKSVYKNPHGHPGEPADANFQVGQPDPDDASSMYGGSHYGKFIGTDISITGPSYRNNYEAWEDPSAVGTHRATHGYMSTRPGERPSTLFDYEPGVVHGLFSDVRAPHTVGVAMGLAAQWHRQQGAERNVAHGMPTHDTSLSSDSAPLAKRLLTRGMIPPNPSGEPEAVNDLGRDSEYGRQHLRVFPGDTEIGPAEMRGGRETLREVLGKKRTAPIQTHTPGPAQSQGEQQRLF